MWTGDGRVVPLDAIVEALLDLKLVTDSRMPSPTHLRSLVGRLRYLGSFIKFPPLIPLEEFAQLPILPVDRIFVDVVIETIPLLESNLTILKKGPGGDGKTLDVHTDASVGYLDGSQWSSPT
eukprot:Filipodium_phascolosomae@DN2540_c0_g1_i1.p1